MSNLFLDAENQYRRDRITRDLQVQALMEVWLYVHVPLSIALLAALVAHVVSVFFYW